MLTFEDSLFPKECFFKGPFVLSQFKKAVSLKENHQASECQTSVSYFMPTAIWQTSLLTTLCSCKTNTSLCYNHFKGSKVNSSTHKARVFKGKHCLMVPNKSVLILDTKVLMFCLVANVWILYWDVWAMTTQITLETDYLYVHFIVWYECICVCVCVEG